MHAEFRFICASDADHQDAILASVAGNSLATWADPVIRIESLAAVDDQGPGLGLTFKAVCRNPG
jgi:hypothetical protein